MCGFDILVSSCNSAGLVNMVYQILLLWYNNGSRCVANMGDRPVAIALTYQFMILQQVTELFVLYFTDQSSSLIPRPPSSFLIVVVYVYSKTSNNGPSEKRTTSLQRTAHLPPIDFTIELIHFEPPRSGHLLTPNNGH